MTVPSCTESRHTWTADSSIGCRENPGYMGIGGSAIFYREICETCSCKRSKVFGDVDKPSRNHGWRYDAAE